MKKKNIDYEVSQVVIHFSKLLIQKPTQFEITILPTEELEEIPSSRPVKTTTEIPMTISLLEKSLVLVDGTYLGLDARCLPIMTREIRQEYQKLRKQQQQQQQQNLISNNDDGQSLLLMVLSCLLLVNPDHCTAWADRRRILTKCYQERRRRRLHDGSNSSSSSDDDDDCDEIWMEELQYINLLMTQHSKA